VYVSLLDLCVYDIDPLFQQALCGVQLTGNMGMKIKFPNFMSTQTENLTFSRYASRCC